MKLFRTGNIETVSCCQEYFGFALPSTLWAKRVQKFELQFNMYISSCIPRSGHSLTLNISETAKHTAIVTMDGE